MVGFYGVSRRTAVRSSHRVWGSDWMHLDVKHRLKEVPRDRPLCPAAAPAPEPVWPCMGGTFLLSV